jgi:hypothetical protein
VFIYDLNIVTITDHPINRTQLDLMAGEIQIVAEVNTIIAANQHVKVQTRAWTETRETTIDLTCGIELTKQLIIIYMNYL